MFVIFAILKTVLRIFTTNIENIKRVILKEVQNATMKIEKKYEINKFFCEKNREKLLQKKRYTNFEELLNNYGELENRLKALEEKLLVKNQCLSY